MSVADPTMSHGVPQNPVFLCLTLYICRKSEVLDMLFETHNAFNHVMFCFTSKDDACSTDEMFLMLHFQNLFNHVET